MNHKKGFTLIELLVVIAIISLLSAIVFSSLNTARAKARDAARKSAILQLANALEIYHVNNGSYPATPANTIYASEPGDALSNNIGNWIPGLVDSGAISALPRDPLGGQGSGPSNCYNIGALKAYLYRSDGIHYKLVSRCALESISYPSSSDQFYDPLRATYGISVSDDKAATAAW